MLEQDTKNALKAYIDQYVKHDFIIEASLNESEKSKQMLDLLQEIELLSEKITLNTSGNNLRKPSFTLKRNDVTNQITFAGIPLGHEFDSLLLAILQIGGHPPKIDEAIKAQIQELQGDFNFETYFSLSCQNCPDVVQALNIMSILNTNFKHTAIDGALFQEEVQQRNIMSVPTIYLNGEFFAAGRMSIEEIIAKLDTKAGAKIADSISQKAPFDVLVIGGGPAGCSSAIYAARKGVRVGLIADRIGGQVNDTMGVENFISYIETTGPKIAEQLNSHIRQYPIDIINNQKVKKLNCAQNKHDLHEVELENGAILKTKTVILALGAAWREMNVTGESTYKTKGVYFCPHCDGPLFKNKQVAVIGGGNSGIEAAIDLSQIASQVTLLEFAETLKADQLLQDKIKTLSNVTVLTNQQTTAVNGDGNKVTSLEYKSRATNKLETLTVDGIFVQIGLLPNTAFLKDSNVELTNSGEILVNAKNHTNIAGIFAAGDCTTVPFKQIVIAIGEGAKAALSAFDHLMLHQ